MQIITSCNLTMFGCFNTFNVRISLLICKIQIGQKLRNPPLTNWEIERIENGKKNLKGDVETSDTRLIDDFDGERFAGNSISSEFNFCRIPFTKRSPKLVFPNKHSLRHHSNPIRSKNQFRFRTKIQRV